MLDAATPARPQPADNVAILTARAPQGARPLGLGAPLAAPVAPGHKIAREDIAARRRHHQVRPGHRLRDQADRRRRARPHPELRVRRARPGLPRRRRPRRRPRRHPRRSRRAPSWATAAPTARSAPATTSRVCATVNCSATVIRRAAEQVMASGILADYPNVDGVVAFAHGTGCGMAASGPGLRQPAARALGPRHPPERRRGGLRRPRLRGDAGRPDEVAPSAPPAPSASTA